MRRENKTYNTITFLLSRAKEALRQVTITKPLVREPERARDLDQRTRELEVGHTNSILNRFSCQT